MTIKPRFEHLRELVLFKYHFYHELDINECTQIILSRIHDGKLWIQDNVDDICVKLIHEVIGLSKQGSVPIGKKIVKKKVEINTKEMYNGKAMVMNTIK